MGETLQSLRQRSNFGFGIEVSVNGSDSFRCPGGFVGLRGYRQQWEMGWDGWRVGCYFDIDHIITRLRAPIADPHHRVQLFWNKTSEHCFGNGVFVWSGLYGCLHIEAVYSWDLFSEELECVQARFLDFDNGCLHASVTRSLRIDAHTRSSNLLEVLKLDDSLEGFRPADDITKAWWTESLLMNYQIRDGT